MAMFRNKWLMISMFLACWSLAATFFACSYWLRYTDLESRLGEGLIYVNVGIDYGNGTREWHNDTLALTGETLFDVTKQVGNVTYAVTGYGTEVMAINNVSKQGSYGWTYWLSSGNGTWSMIWDSVDAYRVASRETYVWSYQNHWNPPS